MTRSRFQTGNTNRTTGTAAPAGWTGAISNKGARSKQSECNKAGDRLELGQRNIGCIRVDGLHVREHLLQHSIQLFQIAAVHVT